jgi:hypothetical protein
MVAERLRKLVDVVVSTVNFARTICASALAITALLTACGSRLPVASDPPTTTQASAATAVSPSSTPAVFRVRWMYLSDRRALVLQQDGFTDQMKAARVRASNGAIVASAERHEAVPGEPRVCGTPENAPPFVVTLPVGTDVADALRNSGPTYIVEVQEDNIGWHATEVVDWTRIAGQPCFG